MSGSQWGHWGMNFTWRAATPIPTIIIFHIHPLRNGIQHLSSPQFWKVHSFCQNCWIDDVRNTKHTGHVERSWFAKILGNHCCLNPQLFHSKKDVLLAMMVMVVVVDGGAGGDHFRDTWRSPTVSSQARGMCWWRGWPFSRYTEIVRSHVAHLSPGCARALLEI